MKLIYLIFIVTAITLLGGCSNLGESKETGIKNIEQSTTKDRVYNNSWNGKPVIVERQTDNGDYTNINEMNDVDVINTLIELLKNESWEENVQVDIRPPDYRFTWNNFNHGVWENKEFKRLELIIEGQSNYGTLSESSSEALYEILTGSNYGVNE